MELVDFRKAQRLSQEDLARKLGLSSKGYVSQLERGEITCSVKLALEIEALSEGAVPARSLSPDVALVEDARGIKPPAPRAA